MCCGCRGWFSSSQTAKPFPIPNQRCRLFSPPPSLATPFLVILSFVMVPTVFASFHLRVYLLLGVFYRLLELDAPSHACTSVYELFFFSLNKGPSQFSQKTPKRKKKQIEKNWYIHIKIPNIPSPWNGNMIYGHMFRGGRVLFSLECSLTNPRISLITTLLKLNSRTRFLAFLYS
jgi:hypothetical protein